ncbi:S1 family peptidase [Corynebacterium sp. CCM 8862]|uniref:S1 family peptidase n=1 Tax=Corynebacterium mendelii TaxID=2765362 RepID=A0A939E0Q9_9CORY|nr:S1 family peptidase [Corynebacterium mendelii]MBN9644830.1 S1 family peptidase [Corynebacterium mendelii]
MSFSDKTRYRIAAAGTALAVAAGLGAAPAGALIKATNAVPGPMADSSAHIAIGNMSCTATLITPDTLLTAKHCIGQGNRSFISIGGQHFGEAHQAKSVILHPSVDLALVKLYEPSRMPTVPISGVHLAQGMTGTIIGWGGAVNTPFMPVQQATAEVQRRVVHVPSPEPDAVLIETFIKGGLIQRGDSGGPLFIDGQLAGIASMSNAGDNNSVEGTIGWYVPVAEYLDWIRRHSGAPVPGPIGQPAPLVDAEKFPTYAPQPAPPTLGDTLRRMIPGLPYIPGLSS